MWVRRYRAEGEAGLDDRSSAPRHAVSAILKRGGLGRLSRLEPPWSVRRYKRMRSPAGRSAYAIRRTWPHQPQTNGKAERFIGTMLRQRPCRRLRIGNNVAGIYT